MTTLTTYRTTLTARRDELLADRDHHDAESAKLSAAIHEIDNALKLLPAEEEPVPVLTPQPRQRRKRRTRAEIAAAAGTHTDGAPNGGAQPGVPSASKLNPTIICREGPEA